MTYLIYDRERTFDEKICHSEQDVRATISGADLSHFTVVEFDTAEGRCRDVSDLFLADEAEELPEPPFNRTAYMRRAGAFSR